MIRGAQKKMIVIRTHDSRVFEEAYFVMRRDTEGAVEDCDMLMEADRIIRRSTSGSGGHPPDGEKKRLRPWFSRALWLLIGVLIGSGSMGLLMLLI